MDHNRAFLQFSGFLFTSLFIIACGGGTTPNPPPGENEDPGNTSPPASYTLTVTNSTGGSVTGQGINCGNDCSETYQSGQTVTLTSSPQSGYTFGGWNNNCGTSSSCTITMTTNTQVAPSFSPVNNNTQCNDANVLCVDDTAGPTQEYSTIQSAVNNASPGDTVLVHDGNYAGFRVNISGTSQSPITIKAQSGGANIISEESQSGTDNIYVSNSNYIIIEGFNVSGASVYGIGFHDASANSPMTGIQVRNNWVSQSGKDNIYLSQVANSVIENNTLFSAVSHGIYLSNAGSDNTILRSNNIYNNGGSGIHFNGDLSVGGDGLQSALLVEKNRIYNNSNNGMNMDGVQSSTIQNNLIYNNGRHGIRGYAIDGAQGPRNFIINNNSLYNNSGWAIKFSNDLGGHNVFNNILMSNSGSIVFGNTGFTSGYNLVNDAFSLDSENTVITFSNWSSNGYGSGSSIQSAVDIFQNTNPNSVDLHLKLNSPAINSGIANFNGTAAPGFDIDGQQRNNVDIGAYRY